jgi:hypothetical protein
MYENTYPDKRFKITIDFIKKHVGKNEKILDLGVSNPLSKIMKAEGFIVENTTGEDLDLNQFALQNKNYDVLTGFEIFEHLLNPFAILKEIKADKILISVPLRLWFASAYKSKIDKWDRHYHEFESWQLDWLLEKTGWEIVDSIQFTHPVKKLGLRPILRYFVPRYYLVYAKKIKRDEN